MGRLSGTYLERILEFHRARSNGDHRDLGRLEDEASAMGPTRGFEDRLRADSEVALAVISEIKRRSPSKGDLVADLDPGRLATSYERGGASCLSVLTDGPHFGGSPDDLRAARLATALPVLRKDFTVSVTDVLDARIMGADCVLLIAAALDSDEMSVLAGAARRHGMDVLVEIHDENELHMALAVDATLIGVNQRDLRTFEVDHERAVRMAGVIPASVVRVAESGVRNVDDARSLRNAGYHAVLVGETLVRSSDPEGAVSALRVR